MGSDCWLPFLSPPNVLLVQLPLVSVPVPSQAAAGLTPWPLVTLSRQSCGNWADSGVTRERSTLSICQARPGLARPASRCLWAKGARAAVGPGGSEIGFHSFLIAKEAAGGQRDCRAVSPLVGGRCTLFLSKGGSLSKGPQRTASLMDPWVAFMSSWKWVLGTPSACLRSRSGVCSRLSTSQGRQNESWLGGGLAPCLLCVIGRLLSVSGPQ